MTSPSPAGRPGEPAEDDTGPIPIGGRDGRVGSSDGSGARADGGSDGEFEGQFGGGFDVNAHRPAEDVAWPAPDEVATGDQETSDVPLVEDLPGGPWPTYRHELPPEPLPGRYFTEAPPVRPRLTAPKTPGVRVLPIVAGIAGLLVVALAVWLLWPDSGDGDGSVAPSPARPPAATEAQLKLRNVLPPGYTDGACTPADAAPAAVARVDCSANSDAGGPTSATYSLLRDQNALRTALDGVTGGMTVLNCPGNIQSPGPWRRNAALQRVAGTLVCGTAADGVPVVAWTDDARLLLSSVRGAVPQGPDLDQLYVWWSSHS